MSRLSFKYWLPSCSGMLMVMSLGCGTITQGTSQSIPVQSSPNGVSLNVEGVQYTTPTTLELSRKKEYVLHFSMEGYESAQVRITRSLSGSYLVFDILLGLIGVVVDAATGGWYNLKPEFVTVSLSKISAVPGPAEIGIAIAGIEHTGQLKIDSSVPGIEVRVVPVR